MLYGAGHYILHGSGRCDMWSLFHFEFDLNINWNAFYLIMQDQC